MSARAQLVHQLQCQGAMTEQAATELADAFRTENITKAISRLRAVPVQCTALTGPVWYGTGWKDCITTLEDIADYQRPDDEAYPGELHRLRALNVGLRAALLRRDDVDWARQQLISHAEHEAQKRAQDSTAAFFQPGRTYAREHHAATIQFLVRYIDEAPDGSHRVAFGWRTEDGDVCPSPFDSDDLTGWTDITDEATS